MAHDHDIQELTLTQNVISQKQNNHHHVRLSSLKGIFFFGGGGIVLYSTLFHLPPLMQIKLFRRMAGIEPRTVTDFVLAVYLLSKSIGEHRHEKIWYNKATN
jgi:hypothetical protein